MHTMVASDYRLEQVTARLIERLEGTRRSFVGDPEAGKAAFERIAGEHVEAAIGEYREVALADDPEPQAELLRREVFQTFLPRYTRIALDMNRSEARRYGFGWLGSPLGRIAFGVLALILMFAAFRMPGLRGMGWTLLPLLLPLPIAPDIVGMFVRGRHRRQLQRSWATWRSSRSRPPPTSRPSASSSPTRPSRRNGAPFRTVRRPSEQGQAQATKSPRHPRPHRRIRGDRGVVPHHLRHLHRRGRRRRGRDQAGLPGPEPGRAPELYGPGLHVQIPGYEKLHRMPRDLQMLELNDAEMGQRALREDVRHGHAIEIQTSDGYRVTVDVTILYRIVDPYEVVTKVGFGRAYEEKVVMKRSDKMLRQILGSLQAEDFFNDEIRMARAEDARVQLQDDLEEWGIQVWAVLVRHYKYDERFQSIIEARKIEDQRLFKNQAERLREQRQATKNEVVARWQADISVVREAGKTKIRSIQADADRYYREQVAAGQKEVALAEADGARWEREALEAAGASNIVGLEMAEALDGTEVIIVSTTGPGAVNPLDLDKLLRGGDVGPHPDARRVAARPRRLHRVHWHHRGRRPHDLPVADRRPGRRRRALRARRNILLLPSPVGVDGVRHRGPEPRHAACRGRGCARRRRRAPVQDRRRQRHHGRRHDRVEHRRPEGRLRRPVRGAGHARGGGEAHSTGRTHDRWRRCAASNREAAAVALDAGSTCATDVTGFGLLGHLQKLALASGVGAVVDASAVPLLPGIEALAEAGNVPGGHGPQPRLSRALARVGRRPRRPRSARRPPDLGGPAVQLRARAGVGLPWRRSPRAATPPPSSAN